MPSKSAILDAMQFTSFRDTNPINTTGSPRFQLTFQFETSQPPDLTKNYEQFSGWTAFSSGEKAAIRSALKYVETFLNVKFVEVSGSSDPDINFGSVSIPGSTAGYGGMEMSQTGVAAPHDILSYDGFAVYDKTIDISSGQQHLILHEILHALGLQHPFNDGYAGETTLPAKYENGHYSIMSYDADPISGKDNNSAMLYDIFALQDIWGAAKAKTGDNKYTGRGGNDVLVIWDTKGVDALDASAKNSKVKLDLRDGHFSKFGSYEDVAIAYGVNIENAFGGKKADSITGNNKANTIKGNGGNDKIKAMGGNDTVRGGGGKDTVDGGTGNDNLYGNSSADTFVYAKKYDKDVIRDFQNNTDVLQISNLGSKANVLSHASNVNGNVKFDFGNGDTLTVNNITKAQIQDDLLVV